jgi:iron(III) transport system substrate-binding protein
MTIRTDLVRMALAGAACLPLVLGVPARAADPALVAAAKTEGQVVWYTTLIVNQAVRPLARAFEKKYGIRVAYARANSGPTAIKILNEANAGRVQADIFDGISTLSPLLERGLVAGYVPSTAAQYPPELKDPDGTWIATNLYFLTAGINTTLVRPAEAPQTYEDLLDPKWKGRIAWNVTSSAGAPGFVGNILMSMGEQKGMAYLKQLAKQDIKGTDASSRAVLDQVIAGDYPLALMIFSHHTVISANKGAPTTWLKMEPVAAAMNTTSLLKAAPHPNAGKLLIEFLTSTEGQTVLQKANYLPALPTVPAKTPTLKPKEGNFRVNFLPPAAFEKNMKKWSAVVKELFR